MTSSRDGGIESNKQPAEGYRMLLITPAFSSGHQFVRRLVEVCECQVVQQLVESGAWCHLQSRRAIRIKLLLLTNAHITIKTTNMKDTECMREARLPLSLSIKSHVRKGPRILQVCEKNRVRRIIGVKRVALRKKGERWSNYVYV